MILNGRVINPGELRTLVTLERRKVTQDAGGFGSAAWAEIDTVYCRWIGAHGAEIWQAQTAGVNEPATVLIRYRDDIDTTCALTRGPARYEIISIDDIQARHEFLELKVSRMGIG